ncbi:YicC/YloC family endoribonuclease [Haloferula sp. A504]|uniref:YicC/YloC family endoribonuclease n=1 Tax=Haloferula sp. A504 TaxID=3373601 RepID=UPI0031C46BCF|nr:YicC family protein [Verrucomicrobiaceae bacterium E54]
MNSMTGFGRGSASNDQLGATIEISGVNRKQAEVVVQGVRDELENRVRKTVLSKVSRGRLQVVVTLERPEGAAGAIDINSALAEQVEQAFTELSARLGRPLEVTPADLIKIPGLVRFEESAPEAAVAWELIGPALDEAIAQLLEMRRAEGADLAADLLDRLSRLESLRDEIAVLAPRRPERYREVLLKRLADSGLEINLDDDRVLREIALFADRCDISEETTRLDAHFKRFREYAASEEPAGRPLDFLCQEIHREFNTIGSKASDSAIAQHVVAAKTELEKIREQVQNVE